MGRAHKCNALGAAEHPSKMQFGVVSREENGLLAEEPAKAVGDEEQRAVGRAAGGSIRCQVVEKVRRVAAQTIDRCARPRRDVCIVAVGKNPSLGEGREEHLWPGHGLPAGSPGAISIARQAMDKANVKHCVGAVVESLHAVGKGIGGCHLRGRLGTFRVRECPCVGCSIVGPLVFSWAVGNSEPFTSMSEGLS